MSWKTLEYEEWSLRKFLEFAYERTIASWTELCPKHFSEFFAAQASLSPRSLKLLAGVLRRFFSRQFSIGSFDRDWSFHVPNFRGFQNQRLPAIWPDAAIESLLEAVDRRTLKGKRDYAILMLACRLGMRAGDIRALRLEHLFWTEARIEFVQGKTGKKQVLPLTEEIGTALIDYLRSRPATDYREVFLRVQAPHTPLLRQNKLYGIISTYVRMAGIQLPEQAQGMHSLRHTVASRLLAAGTPLESIADLLGHKSIDTTRLYTRIDTEQLRSVALDPEVLHD